MASSIAAVDEKDFQYIIRVLNTNIDGRQKVPFAFTCISGIGRRFSLLACKKAEIDPSRRAGDLTQEEVDRLVEVFTNPLQFKIPLWFLNRQRDIKDGKSCQLIGNQLEAKRRDDIERLTKMHCHRGLRHYWGLRVRGQHTKTTGRRGRTVGVSHKKK